MQGDYDLDGPGWGDWEEHTVDVSVNTDPGTGTQGLGHAYLVVLAGNQVGEMIKVDHELIIGRGRSSGLRVRDPSVSKEHARLFLNDEGEVIAEDLGSRNGTFVNRNKIDQYRLSDGDKIYIGTTTILKFSLADSLEESFQKQLYQAAIRDPLTGLYNRRHLDEQLATEVSYARRHGLPVSVIMLDIDHFKTINDTFGHPVGDRVLVGLARRLLEAIRREDLAARFGGEEFAIVCRNTPPSMAVTVAERICRMVESRRFVSEQEQHVVTLSAGIAGMPERGIDNANTLLRAADRALYRAKREGRNRACRFSPSIDGDEDS